MANQSDVFEFTLIGFPGLPQKYHILVSILICIVYIMIQLANGSLFFVHYLGSVDSFILVLMAIDRLVAIDKPLRYTTIITNKRVGLLCGFLWICASIFPSTNAIWHSLFPYCSSRKINNLFCVNMAVMGLACGDITLLKKTIFVVSIAVLILPLSFIILSYIIIIRRISLSSGSESWQKAFYTCTTHLFIIGLNSGPSLLFLQGFLISSPPSPLGLNPFPRPLNPPSHLPPPPAPPPPPPLDP
ncbi:hypothetical protein FKM82_009952 [Ascaphus truei]